MVPRLTAEWVGFAIALSLRSLSKPYPEAREHAFEVAVGCRSHPDVHRERYNPSLRGQGESTLSQTAWAIMGLLICGEEECPEVERGVRYLVDTQQSDGSWEEKYFAGTGFPKHFYIPYDNYRNCFALMALGQHHRKVREKHALQTGM